MKVGLIHGLSPKKMHFWESFIRDLDIPVQMSDLDAQTAFNLGVESLPNEPTYVQLAVGHIIGLLQSCDTIGVPQFEPESDSESNNPWLADFSGMLMRRLSLGALVNLPVFEDITRMNSAALRLGHMWTHQPLLAKRSWERNQPLLKPKTQTPPMERAGHRTVLVMGSSLLLEEPFLLGTLPEKLSDSKLLPLFSHQVPVSQTLEFYPRLDIEATSTVDQIQIGAQAMLAGKSAIRGMVYLIAGDDGSALQLAKKLQRKARKPSLILPVHPETLDETALLQFANSL